MNEDTIADLKQFIATTVSQHTANLATKDDIATLDGRIDTLDKKLSAKIDDLQASVGEALDTSNETVDTELKDHERRIAKLEAKAA